MFGGESAKKLALNKLAKGSWTNTMDINGGATAFIDCLDFEQRFSADTENRLSEKIRWNAPILGYIQSQGVFFCEGITVKPDPVPKSFTNSVSPTMVIASTRDGGTQYEWANDVARTFLNSRVVTYVGTEHSPYGRGAVPACVNDLGTKFLISLNMPSHDMACPHRFRKSGP